MRKRFTNLRLLVAAISIAGAFTITGAFRFPISSKRPVRQGRYASKDTSDMCCVTRSSVHGLSGKSVYQVSSTWTDQHAKRLRLADLAGRIRVISMFYSHCTTACPVTINDMRRIEAALPASLKAKVGFVLVSFDPKRDTPGTLAELARREKMDSGTWELLTGTEGDTRTLAELLGIEYKEKINGDFIHSSQITVLDRSGNIACVHPGLNGNIDDVVRSIDSCASCADMQGQE